MGGLVQDGLGRGLEEWVLAIRLLAYTPMLMLMLMLMLLCCIIVLYVLPLITIMIVRSKGREVRVS